MKKISIILIVIAGLFTLNSCKKAEIGPVVSATITTPVISAPSSGTSLVMTKAQADQTITFTWNPADYGVALGLNYTLQIDKSGRKFSKVVDVISVNATTVTMKYSELNAKMVALEANMEQVNQIVFRVKSAVPNSGAKIVYSDSILMAVTPYTAKDNYYMVGAFNGWNNVTAPVFNRNLPGLKYEQYVNFSSDNSEFKVLPTQGSWNNDMGDDPANPGKLVATGENNMKAGTAGYYKIDIDVQAMTWTAVKYNWSLIGDFNSWAADQPMTYDATSNTLKATFNIGAAGGLKFRANGAWTLNYGDNSPVDGKLDNGGGNIPIASAGNYTITLNLNPSGNPQMYTYTVVKN